VRSWQAGNFDASKGSLAMWAFGIAHNVRLETKRIVTKEAGFVRLAEEELELESEPAFQEHPHDLAVVRKAITALSESEQQIVLLHIDHHLSMNEIANLLDIPTGTIKSHVHRAKEKLKTYFEKGQTHEQR